MKRVRDDGKAVPGTWTLTNEEARAFRRFMRWADELLQRSGRPLEDEALPDDRGTEPLTAPRQ